MFTNIYRRPMTRIAASDWIFDNVPSGATLLYDTPEGKTVELNLPLKGMLFEENGVPLFLDFTLPNDGVIPVSYTHLDVYKRQTMRRAMCSNSSVWGVMG